jgi:hypothetical protein
MEFAGIKWMRGEKSERIPDSLCGFKNRAASV